MPWALDRVTIFFGKQDPVHKIHKQQTARFGGVPQLSRGGGGGISSGMGGENFLTYFCCPESEDFLIVKGQILSSIPRGEVGDVLCGVVFLTPGFYCNFFIGKPKEKPKPYSYGLISV